jgi:hypothetical protein
MQNFQGILSGWTNDMMKKNLCNNMIKLETFITDFNNKFDCRHIQSIIFQCATFISQMLPHLMEENNTL